MLQIGDRIEFRHFELMWRGDVSNIYKDGTGIDVTGCQTDSQHAPIELSISYRSLDRPPILLSRKGVRVRD